MGLYWNIRDLSERTLRFAHRSFDASLMFQYSPKTSQSILNSTLNRSDPACSQLLRPIWHPPPLLKKFYQEYHLEFLNKTYTNLE